MAISQICQFSYNLGISMVTPLQSSPSQRHDATHEVTPPDWTASCQSQARYAPASSHPGFFLYRIDTRKWDLEQVMLCPVTVTLNDVAFVSGTR